MKQKTNKRMGAVLGMAAKAVFWLPWAHMCMCTDSVRHVYLQYTIMHTPPCTFSNGNHKTVQSATQNACPESVLAVRRDSIPCCIWTRWKQKLRERIPSLCTPGWRSDAVQIIIRWFVSRFVRNFQFKSQRILFAYKVAHLHSRVTSPGGGIFNRNLQLS